MSGDCRLPTLESLCEPALLAKDSGAKRHAFGFWNLVQEFQRRLMVACRCLALRFHSENRDCL
jgi:hypothetical protein